MTRDEAIKVLKKKMYEEADEITIEHLDGSQCMRTINIDLEMKEAIEVLEKEEQKVIDILDWKDGDIYKWRNMKYKLVKGVLYVSNSGKNWQPSAYNDLNNDGRMVKIIKTEAVKEKEKAYFVKNQYSFNELMKELEEQGYVWRDGGKLTEEVELCFSNYIFINSGSFITKDPFLRSVYDFEKEYSDRYELIEYHKEEPLYYAKIKGWELTNDGDCYWYKDETPIHGIYPWSEEEASIYTKEEWEKLGITDENADFEEVE